MKRIIKTIKFLFAKDKYSCYIDNIDKINMIYHILFNQIRLANIKNYKYVFSIIPANHSVIIKCQTYNNIHNSLTLNLIFCSVFSREGLADYINKELNVLAKETDYSFNCYKASKYEKNN